MKRSRDQQKRAQRKRERNSKSRKTARKSMERENLLYTFMSRLMARAARFPAMARKDKG